MKHIIYILLFSCISNLAVSQNYPSGVPTQYSTGWFRHGWDQSDSGKIFTSRNPNFTPRFAGTVEFYQNTGVDSLLHLWTGARWIKMIPGFDSTTLSNRINLKLNISDTATMLSPYLRKVDTTNKWVTSVFRKTASDSVFYVKGGSSVFAFKDSIGSGGSGLTSVGLSMPSAFTVTNSPLTSDGTLNVIGAGTTLQYIRGNGTLATLDTTAIPNFYLKVRGLLSGTIPITYNSTTGAIGIQNASATGTKGAATFNNADFTDNGSGLISLRNVNGCNILKEGADTTGNIDASPIIQSLIDGGCKVIYIPEGVYLLSSTIEMRDSVTILGDGRNNTVIKLTTNIAAFHAGQNGQYAQFIGIDFQGTKSTGATTAQEGIFCDSATIYVNNVGGYDLGGFGIRFKSDLYDRPYPFGASLIGSIVSDCNFEKCYGGIKIDTSAEYIGVSNTVMVSNTYGIHIIGGNSRISNCNMSANTYGVYMTYGGNGHHGVAVGNNINHCTYNVYMDSVVLGYSFIGNMIYAGVNQLYIQDSKNVEFLGGDIVGSGTATMLNNDTTIHFTDVNMRTPPTWSVTGNPPAGVVFGRGGNSVSIVNLVTNKRFDMTLLGDSTFLTGNAMLQLRVPTAKTVIGALTTSTHKLIVNNLDSLAGTNKTDIAAGPHLSNGINNTFHGRDTVTSANINNSLLVPAKVAQFHKKFFMQEDGLTFGSKQCVVTALEFDATNSAILNSGNNLQPISTDAGLFMRQFPGFFGTTTYTGTSSPINAPGSIQARYTSTNNGGGTGVINSTGYYSGLITTLELSVRDTLDRYTAINTGSKTGSGINKVFYHHHMHSTPGSINWGVFQTDANTNNYFKGNVLIGDSVSNGIGKLQVFGKATISTIDSTTTALNILYQEPSTGEIKKSGVPASLSSLNLLTASAQTFAVGTSGSDFNISSVTSTHTFNIPTASASNRGLLSTSDWSTFNGKVGNINSQTGSTQTIAAGTGIDVNSSSNTHTISLNSSYITASTYTPTITSITNVDATTAYACQYMRVGDVVTVSGKVDIDPTTTGVTAVSITLPIASSLSNDFELGGTGAAGTAENLNGPILGRPGDDRAELDFTIPAAGSTTNKSWFFTFSYRII